MDEAKVDTKPGVSGAVKNWSIGAAIAASLALGYTGGTITADKSIDLSDAQRIECVKQPIYTKEELAKYATAQAVAEAEYKDALKTNPNAKLAEVEPPVSSGTENVDPIINTRTVADIPSGYAIGIVTLIVDTLTGKGTETDTIFYPVTTTPAGMMKRANVQLTFSNQPIPKE
jgi:hypothetical protein